MKQMNSTSFLKSTIEFVRESFRDNEAEFTSGPIGRALGLLAIPMMLEMLMESIFLIASQTLMTLLGVMVFPRGRWKLQEA